MERIIKFRAWDGEQMQYQFKINAVDGIVTQSEPSTGFNSMNVVKDGWIPMQYTGLKDKNGVEIYEGDVVGYYFVLGEHYTEEGQSMGVEWDGAKMLIEWDTEKARFKTPFSDTENIPVQLDPRSFEVLGNIYEHPELTSEPKN